MRKLVMSILLIILAALLWYGYSSELPFQNKLVLSNTSWQWTGTEYEDDSAITPENPSDFIAQFKANGEFTSSTDCNTAFGSYELNGDAFNLSPLSVTEIACLNDTLEQEYLADLNEAMSASLSQNEKLELETSEGAVMSFTRVEAAE